jgi:DNA-binding response OmpR family regulator
MVIDHDVDFALKLADWLAIEGYEVVVARTAGEALDQLRQVNPHGVLLDLHLLMMSGLELLRVLGTIEEKLPVVTMTTLQELAAFSLKAGARAALLKPFDCRHMARVIEMEIGRPRTLQDASTSGAA